jgi:hypothetical protein
MKLLVAVDFPELAGVDGVVPSKTRLREPVQGTDRRLD